MTTPVITLTGFAGALERSRALDAAEQALAGAPLESRVVHLDCGAHTLAAHVSRGGASVTVRALRRATHAKSATRA